MPKEPDPLAIEAQLEEPVFVRGFDPKKSQWAQPRTTPRWKRHYELLHNNPGQWAKVAEIKKGGPRATRAAIGNCRGSFLYFIKRDWPLERWEVQVVTVPQTWNQRELWARFIGTLTPEEHERDLADRKARYEDKMRRTRNNKERRAAEARRRAEEAEAEAKLQIRARRKPGQ